MLFNSSHLLAIWTHLETTTKFRSSIQSTYCLLQCCQHRFVCYSLSSLFILHSFIEFLKIVAKIEQNIYSFDMHSFAFQIGYEFHISMWNFENFSLLHWLFKKIKHIYMYIYGLLPKLGDIKWLMCRKVFSYRFRLEVSSSDVIHK